MPSSISSSEMPRGVRPATQIRRATFLLFALALGLYSIAEVAARIGLGRFSQIHRRIMSDMRNAGQLRPGLPGAPKTLLVVGNSLLIAGVDFPQLTRLAAPRFQVTRFVVEQTTYYDWDFGLRRLFREGVRPDYVLLALAPSQFADNGIRGDFAARFLFDLADIWPASRAIHADLTTTSSLYFAHFSTFYAARSELRNVFMGKVGLIAVPELWHDIATAPAHPTAPASSRSAGVRSLFADRLKHVSELCAANGVKFLFLIPPTPQPGDNDIVSAADAVHVTALHPIPNYSLGREYYGDPIHLNKVGADIFTKKIAEELLSIRY